MTVPADSPPLLGDDSPITLEMLKPRLQIKDTDKHDAVLEQFLQGALAEYEEYVGPVEAGEYTTTLRTGHMLLLPHAPVLEVLSVTDPSSVRLEDLDIDLGAGLLTWKQSSLRRTFAPGTVVTYRAGGIPANHREAILLDIEGLWRSTQRGGTGRPQLGATDDVYGQAVAAAPLTLYPRIRALAASVVG